MSEQEKFPIETVSQTVKPPYAAIDKLLTDRFGWPWKPEIQTLYAAICDLFDKPTASQAASEEFWQFAAEFSRGFGEPSEAWNIGGFLGSLKSAWGRGGHEEHADGCRCHRCTQLREEAFRLFDERIAPTLGCGHKTKNRCQKCRNCFACCLCLGQGERRL